MDSGFLVVLLLSPVFCYSSSLQNLVGNFTGENFLSLDIKNVHKKIQVKTVKHIPIVKYFNSKELTGLLHKLSSDYGHIVKVTKLGKSPVDQEEIRAIQISSNVQQERELLKPRFRFVANIHGDDAVGYALMVTLVQYLVYSYGVNPRITDMLNTIDIWIVPTLNPDGLRHAKVGRCESPESFTDKFDPENADMTKAKNKLSPIAYESFETETNHNIQRLIELYNFKTEFVLSGNIRAGAIVASYPFSNDNEFPEKLAKEYARENPMMAPGDACNKTFVDGITYVKLVDEKHSGFRGLQNNLHNCLDIALYLACCKYPKPEYLPFYWAANLEAMLTFIESTRKGVFGFVKDVNGKPIELAQISVEGLDRKTKVTDNGEYWRSLLPGTYKITASRDPGLGVFTYRKEAKTVTLTNEKPYVRVDFTLMYEVTIEGYLKDTNGQAITNTAGYIIVGSQNIAIGTDPKTGYYKLTLGVDNGDTHITGGVVGYEIQTKTVNMRNVNLKTSESNSKLDFALKKISS